jgi:hypothetical protein
MVTPPGGRTPGPRMAGPVVRCRWSFVLILAMGLAWTPMALPAQQAEPPRSGEISRQDMVQRVIRQYEHRMMRELGLDAQQLEQVQAIMGEFRPLRYGLMQERRDLRTRVRDEGRSGLDPSEAQRILDRTQALREREVELQKEEERRLLEILDARQVIGLQLLREDLVEQIRRIDARTRSRSGRPGGDDGGGKGDGALQR